MTAGSDAGSGVLIELPLHAYNSTEFFEREDEQIFSRNWVHVAAGHELPTPGDLRPVEVAGRPLLLVRQHEGGIAAFHNVCRHRGARLVDSPASSPELIRCPYHRWAYDLDGALRSTPGWDPANGTAPAGFRRRAFGLVPVRSGVWCDQVFVCLNDEAPNLEQHCAPLAQRWSYADLELLRYGGSLRYEVDANWKLIVENYLDTYHLPFVHPQLGPVATARDFVDIDAAAPLIGVQYPHGAADKEKGNEGAAVFPGLTPAERRSQDIALLFPNTLLELVPDHVMFMRVERVSPTQSREHFSFYFVGEGSAESAAGREAVLDSWDQVNRQDLQLLARLQGGAHSPAARGLPDMAPRWERALGRFRATVAEAMALS